MKTRPKYSKSLVIMLIVTILAFMAVGVAGAQTTSDYSQNCDYIDSNTSRIVFTSNCSSSYVYVHYTVNKGQDMNYLMKKNGNTWTWDVDGLKSNDVVDYWFTYQKDNTQYDTGWYSYTHDGSSPNPNPDPDPQPNPGNGFSPGSGKTLLLIGQTFQNEFQEYVNGTGIAPAGSSHYGELYSGTINQGDDSNNHAYLKWINSNYPNAYVQVAMSIKDNPASGGYSNDPQGVYNALIDVTNGKWDNSIDNFAKTFKSYPNLKFMLRIGYEVNTYFFNSTAYKNAYNYIANRIRNVNRTNNVEFIYHPVRGFEDVQGLYPGNQYVDWIAFSAFNHDVCMETLEADGRIVPNGSGVIDSNFKKSIEWAKERKPVMIAESAFQTPGGGQTPENFKIYLDRLFNIVENYDLQGLVYINSDWHAHNWSLPWGDSRVEINETVKNYWLQRVNNSRYIHYSGSGYNPTPNPTPSPTKISGKGCPKDDRTLLIVGQDLQSVYNYVNSGHFPTPSGVTSYLNLYGVRDPNLGYGGLGEDPNGNVVSDVDWGAGPINTRNAAFGYPDSTLAIGVYMTEQYYPNGLTNIANGAYDAEIDRLGTFISSVKGPVFLRIGYEFDGVWNVGYNNYTNYKNAYKRIIERIRAKADNVVSVWQACTSPVDDIVEGYREDISNWYPGDEYVDWVGYSWFLSHHDLQYSLSDEVLKFARSRNKPVLLSESAPQGYDLKNLTKRAINTGGFYNTDPFYGAPGTNTTNLSADAIWNNWFVPYFNYIRTNSDVIRGVSYINANWDSQPKWAPPYNEGYWGDSRVEVNATIRQKWLDEMNSNFWLHGSPDLFNQLQP